MPPATGPVRGTRRDFRATIATAATREAVWHLWTDVASWGRWDLGLRSASLDVPSAGLGVGSEGTLVPVRGRPARFRVTAFDRHEGYAFETALPGAGLVVARRFGSGPSTHVTHAVRFEGALAGPWSFALGGGFMRALPPTLERLAALALETSVRAGGLAGAGGA